MKLAFIRWYESLFVTENGGGDNFHVDIYDGIKNVLLSAVLALCIIVCCSILFLICGMCGIGNWNVSMPLTSEMLLI